MSETDETPADVRRDIIYRQWGLPTDDPVELRRQADVIESQECTGVAAQWCPIHGTCACADPEDRNDEGCPLHSSTSSHAAASLAEIFGPGGTSTL
jgi:hypothetical protein